MQHQRQSISISFISALVIAVVLSLTVILVPRRTFARTGSNAAVEVAFDLDSNAAQEETVTLPDGTTGTIGIAPLPKTRASYDLGNGTGDWKVYYYTAVLNTGYFVHISNYRITKAYDNHYSGAGCVIDSCTLSYGSTWSTQTTKAHEILTGIRVSEMRILKGNISGHSLITSVQAY